MGIAVHPLERAMRPIQGSDSPVGAPLIVVPPGGAESGSVVRPVQLLVLYQQMGDSIPDFIQSAF